jgi:hypothetical protein
MPTFCDALLPTSHLRLPWWLLNTHLFQPFIKVWLLLSTPIPNLCFCRYLTRTIFASTRNIQVVGAAVRIPSYFATFTQQVSC